MTDQELAAIQELYAQFGKRHRMPLHSCQGVPPVGKATEWFPGDASGIAFTDEYGSMPEEDSDSIVELINSIPRLLAEIQELRKK
jgi:hypothetical protein